MWSGVACACSTQPPARRFSAASEQFAFASKWAVSKHSLWRGGPFLVGMPPSCHSEPGRGISCCPARMFPEGRCWAGETRCGEETPPLRCAPVGMTKGWGSGRDDGKAAQRPKRADAQSQSTSMVAVIFGCGPQETWYVPGMSKAALGPMSPERHVRMTFVSSVATHVRNRPTEHALSLWMT
jgi:hypothetical protein